MEEEEQMEQSCRIPAYPVPTPPSTPPGTSGGAARPSGFTTPGDDLWAAPAAPAPHMRGDPGPYTRDTRDDPGPYTRDTRGDPGPYTRDTRGDPGPYTRDTRGDPYTRDTRGDPSPSTRDTRGDPVPYTWDTRGDPVPYTRVEEAYPPPPQRLAGQRRALAPDEAFISAHVGGARWDPEKRLEEFADFSPRQQRILATAAPQPSYQPDHLPDNLSQRSPPRAA
eukprot:1058334-Prorocentrum_minimum.AAC.1